MKKGFTITELLVVMGVLAVLFSLTSVILVGAFRKGTATDDSDVLISDIRSQELKAMTTASYFGIHFEANSYTLFKGSSYSSSDPSDFVVALGGGDKFANVTFPSMQIIFLPVSGEIQNWNTSTNQISIKDAGNTVVKSLKLNRYGATY